MITTATGRIRPRPRPLFLALSQIVLLLLLLSGTVVEASVGDRLPEFKECVEVRDCALGRGSGNGQVSSEGG